MSKKAAAGGKILTKQEVLMATSKSLWPDSIGVDAHNFEVRLLLEAQADFLIKKTKGIVYASVETKIVERDGVDSYCYDFLITAPLLNYQFTLFEVRTKSMFSEMYPVQVQYKLKLAKHEAYDEGELIEVLRGILNYESTISAIESLWAQSK